MSNIFKTFSTIFIISIFLKLFDIIKSLIVASYLGVSDYADSYLAILSIPDGLLILVGIDSMRGIVNSEFSSSLASGKKNSIDYAFRDIFVILMLIGLVLSTVIFFFRHEIIQILLPGFDEEKLLIASTIGAIIFPVFFFKGLIGFLQSVFNAFRSFYIPIAAPVIVSIVMILFSTLPQIYDNMVYNFSIGYLVGNFFVFILMIVLVFRFVSFPKYKNYTIDPFAKKIFYSSFSIFLLVIANQFFFYSKNFFASYFPKGSISAISYASAIPGLVTTLVFASVFSVFINNLSSSFVNQRKLKTKQLFTETFLSIIILLTPISFILILEANEILSLFYLRGNFSSNDVLMTVKPFYWESLSILSWFFFIAPTALFLSKKKYSLMTKIGVSVYGFGILLNYILSSSFGYYGISMSNFIINCLYGIVLLYHSQRYIGSISDMLKKVLLVLLVGTISFISCFILKQLVLFDTNEILEIVLISSFYFTIFIFISKLFRLSFLFKFKELFVRN